VIVPQLEKAMGLSINNRKVLVHGTGKEKLRSTSKSQPDAVGVNIDKSNTPF
jgi:hypothetical protein